MSLSAPRVPGTDGWKAASFPLAIAGCALMKPDYQVAIIGASLAGSAASIRLGQAGFTVALFDKETFPRHKACGEGLSRFGWRALKSLVGIETVRQIMATPYSGYQLILPASGDTAPRNFSISNGTPHGIAVSRDEIDSHLFECAGKIEGIDQFSLEAVKSIERENTCWRVTSNCKSISAGLLVVASGSSHSALTEKFTRVLSPGSDRSGFSMHAQIRSGRLSNCVSVVKLPQGEIYLTPLTDLRVNISIVGMRSFVQEFRQQVRLDSLLTRLMQLSLAFDEPGKGAACFDRRVVPSHPALFLIGDATESFDPACGLGMTHAITTAIQAGDEIVEYLSGRRSLEHAARNYLQKQHRIGFRIRLLSRMIRRFFSFFSWCPNICFVINGSRIGWLHHRVESILLKKIVPSA